MKTFKITIFSYSQILHSGEFVFKTTKEATAFAFGMYKGFELSALSPTGTKVELIKFTLT